MSMKDYEVTASLNTEQFMSLQNELRETIYVFDCHQFPQFMQPLKNCSWNGRV